MSFTLLNKCPVFARYVSGPYYSRGPTAAAVSTFRERTTKGPKVLCTCIFFSPVWRAFVLSRKVGARLSRRGFSVLTSWRPQCMDTWGTDGPDPPPREICKRWCPVVRCVVWDGLFGYYYLLIFKFIPGSVCSPVMHIALFSSLFTVTFKLKGIRALVSLTKYVFLSIKSSLTSLAFMEDTIQFHLVHT